MEFMVSEGVFRRVKKLLREGKTVPLIKFRIEEEIKRGSVVLLRGGKYTTKVIVEDIREYIINTADKSSIPEELKSVYDDMKLIYMIGKNRVSKIIVVFVKSADF